MFVFYFSNSSSKDKLILYIKLVIILFLFGLIEFPSCGLMKPNLLHCPNYENLKQTFTSMFIWISGTKPKSLMRL